MAVLTDTTENCTNLTILHHIYQSILVSHGDL